ncbi:MAG: DUF1707 SHOCT-like domain-containing protein [Acidimicrobiales bacterium]
MTEPGLAGSGGAGSVERGGSERGGSGPAERGGSGPAELRASDEDRERVATALTEHSAAGRLGPAECAQRLEAAFAARTLPELYALTADLPYPDAVVPGRGKGGPVSVLARLAHLWGRK